MVCQTLKEKWFLHLGILFSLNVLSTRSEEIVEFVCYTKIVIVTISKTCNFWKVEIKVQSPHEYLSGQFL